MNPQARETPSKQSNDCAGSLEKLLKLDPASSLPGYSDGVQAAYAYTPEAWRERALELARQLASSGKPFSVQDLRKHGLPEPDLPQQWGSLVAAMKQRKIAKQVGWGASTTAKGEERGVRIWQGIGGGIPSGT